MSEIERRLTEIRKKINEARTRSARQEEVTLVAVTKFHPLADLEEAVCCGVTDVGENRVQEMEGKFRDFSGQVTWNLIGHLQKNKVKAAVRMADLIQSADSLEILEEIGKRADQAGKVQDILLEFNISEEESKHGLLLSQYAEAVGTAAGIPSLRVRGLMCMAPLCEDPEEVRPVFRVARCVWEDLKKKFPEGQISVLSMGMSNDYEAAIEEGSTMVRIGTAIFGERQQRGEMR